MENRENRPTFQLENKMYKTLEMIFNPVIPIKEVMEALVEFMFDIEKTQLCKEDRYKLTVDYKDMVTILLAERTSKHFDPIYAFRTFIGIYNNKVSIAMAIWQMDRE